MTKEDAKDLTLSILVVVVVLLVADNLYLHVTCAAQAEAASVQAANLAALAAKVDGHLNPPPEPGFTEKAKETYNKAKAAVKNGYETVKGKFASETDGDKGEAKDKE